VILRFSASEGGTFRFAAQLIGNELGSLFDYFRFQRKSRGLNIEATESALALLIDASLRL
jgi:hypothetical protein